MSGNALSLTGVGVGYRNRPIIENLTLPSVERGKLTALIGPNGAGKTTLLRAIARLLPAKGEIAFDGRNLLTMGQRDHASLVSYMPQALPQQVSLSVIEAVITALRAVPLAGENSSQNEARQQAMEIIERLGIGHLAFSMLDQLSGGQRQLASLAQAVVRNPAILLLDEPTSALDPRHQINVMKAVRALVAEKQMTAIVVLHDLNLSLRWADAIVMLDKGRVIASGPPELVVTPHNLAASYGIDARVERCSRGMLHVMADDVFSVQPSQVSS